MCIVNPVNRNIHFCSHPMVHWSTVTRNAQRYSIYMCGVYNIYIGMIMVPTVSQFILVLRTQNTPDIMCCFSASRLSARTSTEMIRRMCNICCIRHKSSAEKFGEKKDYMSRDSKIQYILCMYTIMLKMYRSKKRGDTHIHKYKIWYYEIWWQKWPHKNEWVLTIFKIWYEHILSIERAPRNEPFLPS